MVCIFRASVRVVYSRYFATAAEHPRRYINHPVLEIPLATQIEANYANYVSCVEVW